MKISKEELRRKGWSREEIINTMQIVERAKRNTRPVVKILDQYIYWIVLIVSVGINLFLAFTQLPFLLTLTPLTVYLVLILVALSFGFFFAMLVNGIENLEKEHHFIISLIMPAYSLVFFFVVTMISNTIILKMRLNTPLHNPFIIALAYTIFFILPYAYSQLKRKKRVASGI